MKVLKILVDVLTIMSILFILWMVASYVDVIADNCSGNAVHHSWNMFVHMAGGAT